MTPRERFIETLLFRSPDRVPLMPGGGRESTRERWYSEGLPRNVEDIVEYAYRLAGGRLEWPAGGPGFPIYDRMIPRFEEKVLEKKEDTQIVQDWKGNICEISNKYTIEYLRDAIDFVTRRWIKCPVETREDWEHMWWRYESNDPARLPPCPDATGARLADREHVVSVHFSGPFWQLREWLGFESLCMKFHDDPDFVREMIDFWRKFVAILLKRMFKYIKPDMVIISEDMAFKGYPMISPEMTREFLLPTYCYWGEIILDGGCPVYAVDSDGFVQDLIPVWIEAGVNACKPIEVAAGNDIVKLRKMFGHRMAFLGGVDKRLMAAGGEALKSEIRRLTPVIREGGYIPGCDHGVPADVAWPNYVRHIQLLAAATGWLASPTEASEQAAGAAQV